MHRRTGRTGIHLKTYNATGTNTKRKRTTQTKRVPSSHPPPQYVLPQPAQGHCPGLVATSPNLPFKDWGWQQRGLGLGGGGGVTQLSQPVAKLRLVRSPWFFLLPTNKRDSHPQLRPEEEEEAAQLSVKWRIPLCIFSSLCYLRRYRTAGRNWTIITWVKNGFPTSMQRKKYTKPQPLTLIPSHLDVGDLHFILSSATSSSQETHL